MTHTEQRDGILRILIETEAEGAPQRSSHVIESGDAGTYLITPWGEPLLIIAAPDDPAQLELLGARVRDIKSKVKGGVLHLLVVGGDDRVRAILKSESPAFELSRHVYFHHIDDAGTYHLATRGKPLRVLELAAARAESLGASLQPISREEMREAVARGASAMAEQRRFGEALKRGGRRVTITIAASLAVLFGLELLFGGGEAANALFAMGANLGTAVFAGQPWRLFASAFLHGGLAHAALNSLSLFAIAPLFEGLLGSWRFSVLYLLCALGGSLVSATVHPQIVSIGASGAIWGLMGAAAGLVLRPRGLLPPIVQAQMKQRIWAPLLFNLFYSLQPGIDMACHLGGGVMGFLLIASGAVTVGLPPSTAPELATEKHAGVFQVAAAGLWALALSSIVIALVVGRPWELRSPGALVRTRHPDGPVSMLLPPRLVMHRAPAEEHNVVYGMLDRDPIAVVAGVFGPMSPEERATFEISQVRDQFANAKHEEDYKPGPATVERLGGREVVRQTATLKNGARDELWALRSSDYIVVIHFLATERTPEAWKAIEPRVVESVRAEGEPE